MQALLEITIEIILYLFLHLFIIIFSVHHYFNTDINHINALINHINKHTIKIYNQCTYTRIIIKKFLVFLYVVYKNE